MSWGPIEKWLRERHPEGIEQLGPGADPAEIARFEEELGAKLPEDFVAAWREHDGEVLNSPEYLFPRVQHLPLRAMRSERETMNEVLDAHYPAEANAAPAVGPVRAQLWNRGWIPFALLGGASDFYCIDLDPPDGGRRGQVIRVSAKLDDRTVVASSVAEYFAGIAEKLEDGWWVLREGRLQRAEDLEKRGTPPSVAPKAEPPTVAPWRVAVSVGLAVLFWVAAYFAFTRRTPVAIALAGAAWAAWFVVRRWLYRPATREHTDGPRA